jgi:hypothetical protein
MRNTILFYLICGTMLLTACDHSTAPSQTAATPAATKPETVKPEANSAEGEAVKAALEHLFEVAKTADCEKLAGLLVCKDGPEDQAWKRTLRYDLSAEKLAADKQCAMLQVLTTDLKSQSYKTFSQETAKEGQWYVWVVALAYADGSEEEKTFGFLKIDGSFALGDID